MGDEPLYRQKEWLQEKYFDEGLSQQKISDLTEVSQTTICDWFRRHNIQARSPGAYLRKERATYSTRKDGYEYWQAGDYDSNTQVLIMDSCYVHRLAAVAWFGFDAVCGSSVHHKNGIPWDTRESNLLPMSQSEHASHHRGDVLFE